MANPFDQFDGENPFDQFAMAEKPRNGLSPRPDRSAAVRAARAPGLAAKGFADSALETLAVPLEISGRLARAIGLSNYEPGAWTKGAKDAYQAVGRTMAEPVDAAIQSMAGPVDLGPMTPETTMERGIQGAGRGAADAAAMMLPAGYLARNASGMTQGVAQALAAGPKTNLGATMVGGAVNEMTDSPLAGVAAAMAVPAGVSLAQRLITPVDNQLTPELRRLAAQAQAEGIPLTPGQQTGSKGLQLTESVFNRLPMTSGASEAQRQTQREAFNRAVLSRAGIRSDFGTPDVLAAQKKSLGRVFEDIAGRNTLDFNAGNLSNDLINSHYEAGRRLSNPGPIQNTIDDILADVAQTGTMDGTKYQGWRSTLGKMAKGTDAEAMFAGQVKKALDTAFSQQITPQDAAAWKQASQQYGSLKTILNAMGGPNVDAIAGNIPPSQLSQAVSGAVGREGRALGRGDLTDLAKIGNKFVRDALPDSYTAQRGMMQNIMTGGTMGGVGTAAGLAGMDPTGIAATAAGAYALPKALQTLYSQPWFQRYLTNQLMSGSRQGGSAAIPIALEQGQRYLLTDQLMK